MNIDDKIKRVQTLRYIVASRWFLHAGIIVLGLIQKTIGVAEFDPKIFLLIFVAYSYNFGYYLYLHRDARTISTRGLYVISVLQVVVDQIMYTVILYFSGGVESLSFLFYFITIFIAIVLFSELEIIALTLLTAILYVSVIWVEYDGLIPHFMRYNFDPGFYGNIGVTVHNAATVVLMLVFTAFFAAFISNLIRSRESAITAERDKLIAIVDNLVDGVVLLDPHGKVMMMNPYALRLLHINWKQQARHVLDKKQFPEPLHELIEFIVRSTDEPIYRSQEITVRENDDDLILQATTLQITNQQGENYGSLIILRNITREKDLDEMKSDFISVAAHQLRTPLATLKWLFKIMLDGDGGKLTAKQQDLLQKGYNRNNEVIEIVNNLLDVSEIEDGRFSYKFVQGSIIELIDQAIENAHDDAERKSIDVTFTHPDAVPDISYDRQKMKMVFQNLLDNAVKYSNSGTIAVTLHHENNYIYIGVADSGIGMSEETKSRLFTKFYRGKEAAVQDPTGSGLGLYIVRNILQRHGGSISVDSTLDQGTTFTLTLPIEKKT